MSVHCIW